MTTYDVGERVILPTELRDSEGVLTNADVVLTVTTPSGNLTPVLSNPSTGSYVGSFVASEPGEYYYLWVSTGTIEVVDDGQFNVVPAGSSRKLYASIEELRAHLQDSTANRLPEDELRKALMVSSRSIDTYCGRRFWRDAIPTTRRYRPSSCYDVDIMDIASLDDLVIETDPSGLGTYSTSWTIDVDFELGPDNVDSDGFSAYSWNRLETIGGKRLTVSRRRPTLRITGYHGWSAIPDEVRESAIIKATSLFKRGDAPFGIAGSGDFGAVRISRFEDPDVVKLLDSFRPPLIGVM
jgi:hypothetical protein